VIYRSHPRHPVTGRRIALRARTERELEAYLHRIDTLRSDLRLGLVSVDEVNRALRRLRHGIVTLERAAVAYADRPGLAPNTRARVLALLRTQLAPLAAVELVGLDKEALAPWLDTLRAQGLAPTTIGTTWRSLRSIVRHAAERGWIGALPWGAYRPALWGGRAARPQREAARTLEELARLIRAAGELDGDAIDGELEAKVAAAGLLGLRQGELAGLRWHDCSWQSRPAARPFVVTVARQWDGAGLKSRGRVRVLQTIAELVAILERHRVRLKVRELYKPRGPIFPSPVLSSPGRPLPYRRGEVLSRENLRAAVSRAGLPHVASWCAHSLRDTFVTLEAQAHGGDLVRTASRSGHRSLSSLVRYLHAGDRQPSTPGITALPTLPGIEGPPLLVAHDSTPTK
jgi:integrase